MATLPIPVVLEDDAAPWPVGQDEEPHGLPVNTGKLEGPDHPRSRTPAAYFNRLASVGKIRQNRLPRAACIQSSR